MSDDAGGTALPEPAVLSSAGAHALPGPGPAELPPLAAVPVLGIAVAVAVLLAAFAGRYGYHRDELYFLACWPGAATCPGCYLAWVTNPWA